MLSSRSQLSPSPLRQNATTAAVEERADAAAWLTLMASGDSPKSICHTASRPPLYPTSRRPYCPPGTVVPGALAAPRSPAVALPAPAPRPGRRLGPPPGFGPNGNAPMPSGTGHAPPAGGRPTAPHARRPPPGFEFKVRCSSTDPSCAAPTGPSAFGAIGRRQAR